ncbi:class II aldolase/adducin family protein [Paenibacillus naphthalenovorans]|uniref:class II aldolase/adducin family protein n=1 Tax=Paenibacillus naphthalenovorans TaxID=162209 RepID=UPI003D2962B1
MNPDEAKAMILDIGQRMYRKEWVASNDGNISVKLDADRVLVTPTRQSKGYMTAGMLSIVDRQGHVLEGTYQPTSELKMHLKIYEMRPDVNAVVHAHPPFATSFAVAGIPLDRYILAEAVFELGKVPIAPYATPSTDELTDSFVDLLSEHDCFLLKNHGATTMGIDLMTAYYKMESLEHLAKIMNYASSLGKMDEIPQDKVRVLEGMRQKYGIHGRQPKSTV